MKEQKNPETINPKLFGLWDVVVYSAVIAVVVLLFILFVFIPNGKAPQGFKVLLDGKTVAKYDYALQTLSVTDGYQDFIKVDGDKITVYSNAERTHYNVLLIDDGNKSVKVFSANCSTSKECVYTPALKGDGAIVCAPHKLKIVPLSSTGMLPPQTGGVR